MNKRFVDHKYVKLYIILVAKLSWTEIRISMISNKQI